MILDSRTFCFTELTGGSITLDNDPAEVSVPIRIGEKIHSKEPITEALIPEITREAD